MRFNLEHSFENRFIESQRVLDKYPDRVPIICEKSYTQKNLPNIDKNKYLIPVNLTIGQFIFIIRQRMKLNSNDALFLFVANTVEPTSSKIGDLYQKHKDADGFLYIQYSKENVFG